MARFSFADTLTTAARVGQFMANTTPPPPTFSYTPTALRGIPSAAAIAALSPTSEAGTITINARLTDGTVATLRRGGGFLVVEMLKDGHQTLCRPHEMVWLPVATDYRANLSNTTNMWVVVYTQHTDITAADGYTVKSGKR